MVYRIFSEKKKEYNEEATTLLKELQEQLGIEGLTNLRIVNRYDVENITPELFWQAVNTVFSEAQVDITYTSLDTKGARVFAVEYLPGQFDQRADSAASCIQIISMGELPTIRSAKVYMLYGLISDEDLEKIQHYVVNPVEARLSALDTPDTLEMNLSYPKSVATLEGFTQLSDTELGDFISDNRLAMDEGDIKFCQEYFKSQKRNPTITEIKMIDTYWSDHCRHTTFSTIIDSVEFEDPLLQETYNQYLSSREELNRKKPICLMDLGTIAVKYLKKKGLLDKLDESEEINACTVKINITVDGKKEPWLLLFKNETHNHPTEIEPFGGAATCIGGAIRDPLSGRAYVYGAMRLTGAADPTQPVSATIPGKLSQRKLVTSAAKGYSSYGNQIGLATGIVDEIYHPGYAAKHMELGAVIGAAPAENVRREVPSPGDIVILLGGRTGRDGIGGATGSSKAHNAHSVEECGAEVQKGNAPEERKLQRLFRNKKASRMIKRCNDFGAGGVSVAIGELADGLEINLNEVPKKYAGLDGTELAISESQERMAVVVEGSDVDSFLRLANEENLEATPVAVVTKNPRLIMYWNGKKIVDIDREFLNSNGAEKHITVHAEKAQSRVSAIPEAAVHVKEGFSSTAKALLSDLNVCSKRGLSEGFDSTIGAGTVLMPFGGKYQLTPIQAMVQKISVEKKHTEDCSIMSYGYNPYIASDSPYHGAYLAVVESVSKLIAVGGEFKDVYLTFQEYFERLGNDPTRWGKPLSALLGAFKAQMELKIAAIGGKDSMSGSFEDLDVPPTLVSFAVTTAQANAIISPEFKREGSRVVLISPKYDENNLPVTASLLQVFNQIHALTKDKLALSVYTLGCGGILEAIAKMSFGNGFGFAFDKDVSLQALIEFNYGSFVVELSDKELMHNIPTEYFDVISLGKVTAKDYTYGDETLSRDELLAVYEERLERVYKCNIKQSSDRVENFSYKADSYPAPHNRHARPKVLIPVFPGTNCEYDSTKAAADAGCDVKCVVINNLSPDGLQRSADIFAREIQKTQIIFIPGGFSGGDEPEGSGKFITAFFRNSQIKENIENFLDNRNGLMLGICNGFQALIKLGLVPYGKIIEPNESCPTLTFNTIGRHQSRLVRTRIASNKSPWLSLTEVGDIVNVPISHGEGRFVADENLIKNLAGSGQIATQYVDLNGNATMDIHFNPNNSMYAIEGITSPDGRVLGKMGHSERIGSNLYKNVPGSYDIKLFQAAVNYFKGKL